MTDSTPNLRSLSPAYVSEQHAAYVNILKAKLAETGPEAPLNIALTGHYGSGKSSVLLETQRELQKSGLNVINLSLPSLGVGDGRIRKDGDKSLDRTNLIQKEIVKQLLYRRRPSNMPASRYSRLDTFRVGRAILTACGIGAVAAAVALMAKLPSRVRDSLPQNAWNWLNDHLPGRTAGLVQWLSLLVVFALTVWFAVWVQRLLQQRLRVTELGAGPTKVTLSDETLSFFDEYLDEIVYFFQTSATEVVIFEDLDRFKDPHIFEALRELNLLLNNAEQTGKDPIRFVYAIRDSIFEQLDDDGNDDQPSADHAEVRRLMSTNRTKFFDLVVPMVPFISHRTSRELVRAQLGEIPDDQRPGDTVVDIVSARLTDMRLIKNICNEYDIFRAQILRADGLKELKADHLFASIVYKNLYLADYEKIRDGTSQLDKLYRAYRDWVAQQTASARTTERLARRRLRRLNSIGARASGLGTRLQDVLLARYLQTPHTKTPQVAAAGTMYDWSALKSEGFWKAYLQDRGDLRVRYNPSYPEVISFEQIETLMGSSLSSDGWTDETKAEIRTEIAEAVDDRRWVQHASMADALAEPDRLFTADGETSSMADLADGLFGGSPLVLELLRVGLIDENFTLYITRFPGQAISASAMNFIIKAVQPDLMDVEYHFGTGEDVNTDDIKSVLNAERTRLLGGQSVYNVQIFDYLLAEDPSKLDEPIRRLATNAAEDRGFIDAYLTAGSMATSLVRRLSAVWPAVFDYLIGQEPETRDQLLLDAALGGALPQMTYAVTAQQRTVFSAALPELETITKPQTAERAQSIAKVLEQMHIRVDDLAVVAEPLRHEISTRSIYPVTLGNLRTIVGTDDQLPLDRIKGSQKPEVYRHIIEHLRDYLVALDSAPGVPTIADADQYAPLLADVGPVDSSELIDVARRAADACMVNDLSDLDVALWPSLATVHRIDPGARNVAAYIKQHGIDTPLVDWLTAAGAVDVDKEDATPLVPLALTLLNTELVSDGIKLKLVDSLGLEAGSIEVASLDSAAHSLLPALVESQLVNDDSDAFTALSDDEWRIKEALISVSAAFPAYMTTLDLSSNELLGLASQPVPDAVKQVLLNELDAFKVNLGRKGAAALASWAALNGHIPTPQAILTLATKGGPESATSIVRLLATQAETIDLDLLKGTLDALGNPYAQLTSPGRDRPKVKSTVGMAAVLARLQKADIVSKFVENSKKGVFEVSKRHM